MPFASWGGAGPHVNCLGDCTTVIPPSSVAAPYSSEDIPISALKTTTNLLQLRVLMLLRLTLGRVSKCFAREYFVLLQADNTDKVKMLTV